MVPGDSLVIKDTTTTDSGDYECRIMLSQTLSVTHSLLVTQAFSVQVSPNT